MNLLDVLKARLQNFNILSGDKITIAEILTLFLAKEAPVKIEAYDGSSIGAADAPYQIKIKNETAINHLMRSRNELGLLRAYLTGTIEVNGIHPGDPYEFLRVISNKVEFPQLNTSDLIRITKSIGIKNFQKTAIPPLESPPKWQRLTAGVKHNRKRDALAVQHHFDISNDFYELILGESMTYTCAVYNNHETGLTAAQENKYRLIFDKLNLAPGDKLLDLGCGWGGMVKYAAKRGIQVIGTTISKQQAIYGQQKIIEEQLDNLAEIRFSDYRDIPETGFDAITSIGLTEHLGVKNYSNYFKLIRNKLKPGGLFLNHCITRANNNTKIKAGPIIDKYIFPDGELTGSGKIISTIQNIGGLEVLHTENLREHYALTLRDWCNNLVKHWESAVAATDLSTAKLWGIYLAGSRLGFDTDVVQIHQILSSKLTENNSPNTPLRPWWKP